MSKEGEESNIFSNSTGGRESRANGLNKLRGLPLPMAVLHPKNGFLSMIKLTEKRNQLAKPVNSISFVICFAMKKKVF